MTILIIDDDPAVLRAYGRLLQRLGHDIVLETRCDAAGMKARTLGEGDLVILDQQMPGTCGLDWLRQERQSGAWDGEKGMPAILLITASQDETIGERAAALGITAVIQKPVEPRLFIGTVERTLARRPGAGTAAAASLTGDSGRSYTERSGQKDNSGGLEEQQAMNKHGQLVTLALFAAASVIFGMVLAGGLNLTLPGRAAEPERPQDRPFHSAAATQNAASRSSAGSIPASFADVADMVNPAVVSITATERVQPREGGRTPFHGDPFEFFFGPQQRRRSPGGQGDEPYLEQSGGSGFLISDDGYIVTNYHVVEDASQIQVNLSGDQRNYEAEIVGTDPSTDLALIKINVDKRLPYLPFGDSDSLRIGDWVLAVGNPLSYEHTVTVGVVSAKGRQLRNLSPDPSLDNFIQTDAAINFGNSGGPLVNMAGEVVGVNTAISSVGQGIGFAVPVNITKEVMGQLRSKGRVSRGYLGITLGPITPDMQEFLGLESDRGSLVQSVQPGLPADAAGVKRGDVIIAVNGEAVASNDEIVRRISSMDPGKTVKLTVIRDGKQIDMSADLVDRTAHIGPGVGSGSEGAAPELASERMLGLRVEDLTPRILQEIDLPGQTSGVVITRVSRVSESYQKGLGEGDVITEVNREPVENLSDYRRAMRQVKEGGLVVLYVINPPSRTGGDAISRYVTLRMQEQE
jgi:serine protease Do